jgi:hypothetical protein
MIADIFTGDVNNYCVENIFGGDFGYYSPTPIWSLDGNQLMVDSHYTTENTRLLIIDMQKNIAFPIAENVLPIGWMILEK